MGARRNLPPPPAPLLAALTYWKHDRFDLDELSDDECNVEFCFLRNDIYSLIDAMSFPDFFKCYNGLKVDGVQSMCIF